MPLVRTGQEAQTLGNGYVLACPGGQEGTPKLRFLDSGLGSLGAGICTRQGVALWHSQQPRGLNLPCGQSPGYQGVGLDWKGLQAGEASLERWHPLQATLPAGRYCRPRPGREEQPGWQMPPGGESLRWGLLSVGHLNTG